MPGFTTRVMDKKTIGGLLARIPRATGNDPAGFWVVRTTGLSTSSFAPMAPTPRAGTNALTRIARVIHCRDLCSTMLLLRISLLRHSRAFLLRSMLASNPAFLESLVVRPHGDAHRPLEPVSRLAPVR